MHHKLRGGFFRYEHAVVIICALMKVILATADFWFPKIIIKILDNIFCTISHFKINNRASSICRKISSLSLHSSVFLVLFHASYHNFKHAHTLIFNIKTHWVSLLIVHCCCLQVSLSSSSFNNLCLQQFS